MSAAAVSDIPASPAPALAVSAIVRREGRYLLVLRANPPAADMYAFPGGRVEPGETLAAAALRELAEETGIIGVNPRVFETFDLSADDPKGRQYILTVFTVEEVGEIEVFARDDAAEAAWFEIAEARLLPMPASMHDCFDMLERGYAG